METSQQIIEWLRSPEGEEWSHANVHGMSLALCSDLVDFNSEVYMPGMFGVRSG